MAFQFSSKSAPANVASISDQISGSSCCLNHRPTAPGLVCQFFWIPNRQPDWVEPDSSAFRFIRRCWFERSRPDLPEGCREPLLNKDMIEHLRIIFDYRNDKESQLLKAVRKYRNVKHIHELYGRRQVDAFIEDLDRNNPEFNRLA